MLAKERQKLIYQRLETDGRVVAGDLAVEFDVSEDSIRRDLREMAAAQQCERVYGGALRLDQSTPMGARLDIDKPEKQKLAKIIVREFEHGASIFIDASSTNVEIARAIPANMQLTVITNAPVIAAALADFSTIDVIMIGGKLTPCIGACVDARAIQDALLYNPDLYVMGVCGLNNNLEVTAEHHDDAIFKRAIAERSSKIILPVTGSKMGVDHRYSVLSLNQKVELVLTGHANHDLDAYAANGCKIVSVS